MAIVFEQHFPVALINSGMRTRVQAGRASVEADRRHILNTIADRELEARRAHPVRSRLCVPYRL